MPRRSSAATPTPAAEDPAADAAEAPVDASADKAASVRVDLSDLPVLGITRRRAGYLLGALIAGWVLIVFAHQVGEAAAASSRVDALRASNEHMTTDVGALEKELDLIRRPAFIALEARRYRLGEGREIPFQLANDAPPLPDDAPGSAAVKLGAEPSWHSPLESWLEVLFGPAG
jgi:hypothetical protein